MHVMRWVHQGFWSDETVHLRATEATCSEPGRWHQEMQQHCQPASKVSRLSSMSTSRGANWRDENNRPPPSTVRHALCKAAAAASPSESRHAPLLRAVLATAGLTVLGSGAGRAAFPSGTAVSGAPSAGEPFSCGCTSAAGSALGPCWSEAGACTTPPSRSGLPICCPASAAVTHVQSCS